MVNYQITQNLRFENVLHSGATRRWGNGGGSLPCLFWKSRKKPWFWEKRPWLCPSLRNISGVFNKMLIKCHNSTKPAMKNIWLHACQLLLWTWYKFGMVSLCYISVLLFSLSSMYDFILLLITEGVIQLNMIVMILSEIDETTWTGEMQDSQ